MGAEGTFFLLMSPSILLTTITASATSYSNEDTASQVVPSSSFFRQDRKGLSIIPPRPPTLCFHATRSFETLLALVVLPVHATRRDFSLLVDLLLTFHGTRRDRTHIVRVLPRVCLLFHFPFL
jgi:hypothetical protein